MTNLYEEWQKLCDEHDAARDAYSDASKVVNSKLAAVVKGTSGANPTEEELEKSEVTWKALEDVRSRLQDFVRKNTGGSDEDLTKS